MNTIKHTLYTLALVLLMSAFAQAQMRGKWVLPTNYAGVTSTVYQLTFDATGVSRDAIQSINGSENFVVSAGGYNLNYDRNFHALHKTLYYGQSETPLYTSSQAMLPGLQIIQKANVENEYFAVYINEGSGNNIGVWYNALEYDYNSGNPIFSVSTPLGVIGGLFYRPAFTMTDLQNNERFVYIASVSEETSIRKGRLVRWRLGTNGFTDPVVLLEDGDQPLTDELYFEAYKMENSVYNGEAVVAWIHGLNDSNYTGWNHTDEIVVVSDTVVRNFDLDLGRIGGIEFSTYEPGIIYASCTNRGIVKLNYTTGQVTNLYAPTPVNFSRTALQTAPDGHIYAVSNDGSKLGRILQHGNNAGTFEANNVLDFPQDETLATYQVFDNLTYYVLPENKRVYTPLEVSVTTQPESCPHANDGRVEISVSGGVPYNDVDAPYLITSVPAMSWRWDTEGLFFYQEELTKGVYSFTITDNATPLPNVIDRSFVIEVDNSYFDFKNDFFQVESSTSLPNTTYPNTTYSFEKGIHVHAGATLTINNCFFEFGSDAKIIIEPNAKLIVNNSTLTNSPVCDLPWQGVEVWGNSQESQQPALIGQQWVYHQGRLSLNGATISNAQTAVAVLKRDTYGNILWNTGGGIVVAGNTNFFNNTNSVTYIPYKETNIGRFTNCTFEIDSSYQTGSLFYKHIDLNQVSDIRFTSCSFSNSATTDVSPYNQGIASYNSSFRVLPGCENSIIPCPDENQIPSLFTGFYRAVAAYNDGTRKTTHFEVDNTLFISNSTGIYATNTDGAVMTDNTFEIGYNNTDCEKCGKSGALGIDLLASVNFVIENNGFSRHSAAQPGDYVGIRVTACPSEDDDIYRNQFNGLSVGNMAVGVNRSTSTDDRTGVSYQCNENVLNDIDFWVKDFSKESRIRGNVGEQLLASGNTLTDPTYATIQFLNDYTQYINYYYVELDNQALTEYTDTYVVPILASNPNPCLPQYGSGGGGISLSDAEKTALELEYADGLADYNSVETLYNSLLDDGNTQAEIASLQAASPADMWTLRSKLLGTSPHLSDEVLKQMADRADVFPDAVQFEVLASNPEELRKEELMSYLEQKSDPLPEYMLEILRQVATGSSYKSVLQSQMSFYQEKYVKSAQRIIRSLLFDSITDYNQLRQWYDNIGGYQMDLQIVNTWIAEGAYDVALDFAEALPAMHQLEGDQLAAHEEYMSLLEMSVDLEQQNRNIRQLTAQELAMISSLAQTASPHAQSKAKAMLEYAYGEHYFECPDVPESVVLKSTKPISADKLAEAMGLQLKAEPNPAADWTQFSWQLAGDAGHAILEIYDGMGRLLQSIQLQGNQGTHLFDTRKLPAGIYSCVLKTAGMQKTVKLVIH